MIAVGYNVSQHRPIHHDLRLKGTQIKLKTNLKVIFVQKSIYRSHTELADANRQRFLYSIE